MERAGEGITEERTTYFSYKRKTLTYLFILCVCLSLHSCVCRSEDSVLELVLSYALWILEIEFNSSGLARSTFTYPAIPSLKPQLSHFSSMEKTS